MRLETGDLRVLVALVEEGSVTAAGDRIGVSQSAISHRIAAWNSGLGRPLFVKSGRNLVPTPEAHRVATESKRILEQIDHLLDSATLDLATMREQFTISSTDFERGIFLHDVQSAVLASAPQSSLHFVWGNLDSRAMLQQGKIDLSLGRLTTALSEEFHWANLFSDKVKVFYDPDVRSAPVDSADYWSSRHVRVIFSRDDDTYVDNVLSMLGHREKRSIATEVPSLWEIFQVLKGTNLLVTTPSALLGQFGDRLACCDPPMEITPITVGMLWHERTHYSAAHRWLRSTIKRHVASSIDTLCALNPAIELRCVTEPPEALPD